MHKNTRLGRETKTLTQHEGKIPLHPLQDQKDAPTKLDIVASEVLTSELYQAEFWVTYNGLRSKTRNPGIGNKEHRFPLDKI